jgi:hypothetical protein
VSNSLLGIYNITLLVLDLPFQSFGRIRQDLASGQLVPTGDLWPRFIYKNYEYSSEDVWDGLLRSILLVKVCLRSYALAGVTD